HNISIPGLVIDPASDEARYEIVGFDAFLSCYIALSQCLQDRQDFIDLIASVAGRLSEQNVRYAELTFTPMTHVGRGLSPEMLLESLAEGSALARTLHNIELAWVFDIVRCFPETSMATVELALRGRQSGLNLVALGIGGPEGPTWPGHAIA